MWPPTPDELVRVAVALVLAGVMATRGHRKGALSRGGAAAAFVVGLTSLASGYRFGAALLSFYYAGTRATRFGAARKKRLEDGYTHALGRRSAAQVLASSLPGTLCAALHAALYRTPGPLSAAAPAAAALQLCVLLFFAACAGDTLASEVGSVAAARPPVLLVAPWRAVPPGTNGAVSWPGTLASALGGLVVGFAFAASTGGRDAPWLRTLLVGALGGLVGSAVDSVLGTIAQASWYDPRTGKVLKEAPRPGTEVAKRARHICGADVLSGEAVNCISAILTCLLAPALVLFYQRNEVQL